MEWLLKLYEKYDLSSPKYISDHFLDTEHTKSLENCLAFQDHFLL